MSVRFITRIGPNSAVSFGPVLALLSLVLLVPVNLGIALVKLAVWVAERIRGHRVQHV
jgi:hypothetical protein